VEKLGQLIIRIFFAIWDRIEARKADRDHADAVRHDPGAAWLRRFGGKDERANSARSCDAERESN
jgi:hypothetical protein